MTLSKWMSRQQQQLLLMVITTVSLSCQAMLMSKVSRREFAHRASLAYTVSLAFDLTKLAVSYVLFCFEQGSWQSAPQVLSQIRWESAKAYCIPALIYLVDANLLFFVHTIVVNPAIVEVLSSMRILTTTVFFWYFLGRSFNRAQVVALVMLAAGTATTQLVTCSARLMLTSGRGAVMMMVYSLLSGFAAVYLEHLLKRSAGSESFYLQNMQLYFFGMVFNVIVLLTFYFPDLRQALTADLLSWTAVVDNRYTVALVVANTSAGLSIAALLRYANTIEKVYAQSISVVVTLIMSTVLLGHQPSAQLVLGTLVVTCSIYLYHIVGEDQQSGSEAQSTVDDKRNSGFQNYQKTSPKAKVTPGPQPSSSRSSVSNISPSTANSTTTTPIGAVVATADSEALFPAARFLSRNNHENNNNKNNLMMNSEPIPSDSNDQTKVNRRKK